MKKKSKLQKGDWECLLLGGGWLLGSFPGKGQGFCRAYFFLPEKTLHILTMSSLQYQNSGQARDTFSTTLILLSGPHRNVPRPHLIQNQSYGSAESFG